LTHRGAFPSRILLENRGVRFFENDFLVKSTKKVYVFELRVYGHTHIYIYIAFASKRKKHSCKSNSTSLPNIDNLTIAYPFAN
jgi:uncharacterized protein YpiB (UPF0302 family)